MGCERCDKLEELLRRLLQANTALYDKLYDLNGYGALDGCELELQVIVERIRQIEDLIGKEHCPKCWEPSSVTCTVDSNGWTVFTCQTCGYTDQFESEYEEDPYAEYREDYGDDVRWE
jgi:hypothetical protein